MLRGQVYKLGTNQTAAYTSAANSIAASFGAGTQVVRVLTTTRAHVKIGNSPTATTSDPAIGAYMPEYFIVAPGMKASAIRVTTNGTLHVSELSG